MIPGRSGLISFQYNSLEDTGNPPRKLHSTNNNAAIGTDAQGYLETEIRAARSDDETVIDELKSLGPKTPVQQRISHTSYVLETPKHGRPSDTSAMGPPAKRARLLNSSQAMSPANVSQYDV